MGLLGTFKKKQDYANSFGEPLDKLVDGDLPWGWYSKNQSFIESKETSLINYAFSSKSGTIDERIAVLKEMIAYYEEIKLEFYSKDECFQKYFYDSWEHCSNSSNNTHGYISPYKETLKELLANHDSLKSLEERRKANLTRLDKRLYDFLKQNNGIMQKDIYKHFDSSIKSDIQDTIYNWSKSGRVERIKTGNSYRIYVIK